MVVKIEAGQTLQYIADRFHTTVSAICEENRLRDAEVAAGMRVVVHGYVILDKLPQQTLAEVCRRYCLDEQSARVLDDWHVRVEV